MKKSYITAITYSFLIGFSFMATKITVTLSDPFTVLAHRFLIGSIIFIIYRLLTKTKSSITKKDLKTLLPLSLSYPLAYFLVQAIALSKISSGEVGIIFAGAPALTLLIASIFINEKSSTLQKLGIFVSVFGVILIFIFQGTTFNSGSVEGYIWAIAAALVFAIYNTHARVVLKNYKFFDITEFLLLTGAIIYNILVIPKGISSYIAPFSSLNYVIAILYIGVFASVFASLTANYTLTKLKASQLTIFTNLATLISILAGVIILNESIYWYHYLSTVLIILGVLLANNVIKRKTVS